MLHILDCEKFWFATVYDGNLILICVSGGIACLVPVFKNHLLCDAEACELFRWMWIWKWNFLQIRFIIYKFRYSIYLGVLLHCFCVQHALCIKGMQQLISFSLNSREQAILILRLRLTENYVSLFPHWLLRYCTLYLLPCTEDIMQCLWIGNLFFIS